MIELVKFIFLAILTVVGLGSMLMTGIDTLECNTERERKYNAKMFAGTFVLLVMVWFNTLM